MVVPSPAAPNGARGRGVRWSGPAPLRGGRGSRGGDGLLGRDDEPVEARPGVLVVRDAREAVRRDAEADRAQRARVRGAGAGHLRAVAREGVRRGAGEQPRDLLLRVEPARRAGVAVRAGPRPVRGGVDDRDARLGRDAEVENRGAVRRAEAELDRTDSEIRPGPFRRIDGPVHAIPGRDRDVEVRAGADFADGEAADVAVVRTRAVRLAVPLRARQEVEPRRLGSRPGVVERRGHVAGEGGGGVVPARQVPREDGHTAHPRAPAAAARAAAGPGRRAVLAGGTGRAGRTGIALGPLGAGLPGVALLSLGSGLPGATRVAGASRDEARREERGGDHAGGRVAARAHVREEPHCVSSPCIVVAEER